MLTTDKECFKLATGHVDRMINHPPKYRAKCSRLQRSASGQLRTGPGLAQGHHASHMLNAMRYPCIHGSFPHARRKSITDLIKILIRRLISQQTQRRATRCHGHWVTTQGTGLKDLTRGQYLIHDFGATSASSQWQPTTDDFPKGCRIGCDSNLRAPPSANRKPVMTSSKIRTAPSFCVSSRRVL